MIAKLWWVLSWALTYPAAPAHAQAEEPPEPAVVATPYGLVAASFFWASNPLVNEDAPIAAAPGTERALGATARQSRLGLRVRSGPLARALSADEAGVTAEIDFFGGWYADNDITYAMSHPRLRLFFARVSWGEVAAVVGQDWIVFAPLSPVSVVHVAVAGFQGAGNAWARLPQARIEATAGQLSLRGAVLAPVSAGPVDPMAQGLTVGRKPGGADRSETPSLEARAAYTIPAGGRELVAGVSAHYGRERVSFGDPVEEATVASWGAALDVDLPLLPFLSLTGELVYGANLDGLFVNAGVVDDHAVTVVGGWGQLSLRFAPVSLHVGAGVEDPRAPDDDALPDGAIDENAAVYVAAVAEVGPAKAGVEVSHLWTSRAGSPASARGTQIALGALVAF